MRLDADKKEFGGWWLFTLFLVVITVVVLGITGTFGQWFGVTAERAINKASYQRSSAYDERIATYRAQRAQVRSSLTRTTDEATRIQLENQLAMLQVQIASAEAQR